MLILLILLAGGAVAVTAFSKPSATKSNPARDAAAKEAAKNLLAAQDNQATALSNFAVATAQVAFNGASGAINYVAAAKDLEAAQALLNQAQAAFDAFGLPVPVIHWTKRPFGPDDPNDKNA